MRVKFTIAYALVSLLVSASGNPVTTGGRQAAMGFTTTCQPGLWGAFANRASLAESPALEAGFYYDNRFMINEMALKAAAFSIPAWKGAFAVSYSHFGFEEYNDQSIGFSYGRSFGPYLAVGIGFNVILNNVSGDYEQREGFTFSAGLLIRLSNDWTLGAYIDNPASQKLSGMNEEKIASKIATGLMWKVSEGWITTAEVVKVSGSSTEVHIGAEYQLLNRIYLRGGLSTGPSLYTFGAGLHTGRLRIDISSSVHTVLGYSPQLSLSWRFTK
ncbi:MAG TPA: hypothetical protein DCR43_03475 [Bacteroidales bacterium]|nr:MAG: hypothetical protein A2X11_00225 [Bacteroidetes bacterium GWE2_42_24]OFY27772.1 MAG: hypothetical protein A2X09_02675 [Bacteroidetes bacterium GWF2_43_11]HAQ64903.1 hypothetical protein [Bacteroidales bacterium]HBZ66131.1 hypothetical protein [Bacteroidales bacterium]